MIKRRFFRSPILGLSLVVGALFFSGCLNLSVNPLYDEATLTYEPGLVGLWGDPGNSDDDTWEFQPAGDRLYRLVIRQTGELRVDQDRDGLFEARLVRLDGNLFLDLFPEEPEGSSDFYNSHIVPAHSIWRVRLDGHALSLSIFENEFLEQGIEDGTIVIDHVKRDGVFVFTASTAGMQELVSRFADELFGDSETMQRIR